MKPEINIRKVESCPYRVNDAVYCELKKSVCLYPASFNLNICEVYNEEQDKQKEN
jgi:hypothetical protein